MRKYFVLLVLALLCTTTFAHSSTSQFTVRGIAMDTIKNEPVAYATAVLMDSLQKPIASTYSETDGSFALKAPKGKYTLTINFVGFAPVSQPITIDQNMDLGVIAISQGIQIGAAQVIGQLVTTDLDKTTYNTAADPETPALTALEMMRKVPMLSVDGDDNLKLKGESNFKILVNGKSSTLMGNNYKEVLKSMPAGSIKNIEVITNPPAKYDAEGIGGIINIITNRKTADGFTGSVGIGGDSFGGWNGNAYIAAALGKFNISGNYFIGHHVQKGFKGHSERENFDAIDAHYINSTTSSSYDGQYQGLNLEASYEIDTFNLVSLSLSGFLGGGTNKSDGETNYFNQSLENTVGFQNVLKSKNEYGSVEASLDYQKTFKKPDQTFTVSYKFEYSPDNSSYTSDLTSLLNYEELAYTRRSKNTAAGYEHTFQADYFEPINEHHQVEAGIKYIMRPNVSNTFNEDFRNDQWVENLTLKNDLDYLQHIGSAYAAYQYKYKTFSVKGGLRAEYTVNSGTFKLPTADQGLFNRYFNIVPYLTIGFKPADNQQLRLGYTQRLSRPGIWYLNPYVDNQDPMNVSTGNPDLTSEISHSFDLSYGLYEKTFNINASLGASINNNSIQRVTEVNPATGGLLTTPQNIGHRQRYTANLSSSVRMLNNKMNLNINASGGFVNIAANNGSGLKNHGWEYSCYLNFRADTWKGGNAGISGGVFGPNVQLQGNNSLFYFTSLNVSQQFLEKKLRLSLSVQDPFTSHKFYNSVMNDPNFVQHSSQMMQAQLVRLNLTWRFGSMKGGVKKVARSINNDDSAGGGKSGGAAPASN